MQAAVTGGLFKMNRKFTIYRRVAGSQVMEGLWDGLFLRSTDSVSRNPPAEDIPMLVLGTDGEEAEKQSEAGIATGDEVWLEDDWVKAPYLIDRESVI